MLTIAEYYNQPLYEVLTMLSPMTDENGLELLLRMNGHWEIVMSFQIRKSPDIVEPITTKTLHLDRTAERNHKYYIGIISQMFRLYEGMHNNTPYNDLSPLHLNMLNLLVEFNIRFVHWVHVLTGINFTKAVQYGERFTTVITNANDLKTTITVTPLVDEDTVYLVEYKIYLEGVCAVHHTNNITVRNNKLTITESNKMFIKAVEHQLDAYYKSINSPVNHQTKRYHNRVMTPTILQLNESAFPIVDSYINKKICI